MFKKNRKIVKIATVVFMISAIFSGCTSTPKDTAEEDAPMKAVFLKNEYGEFFVDLEQDSPFFGTIPEEIYDKEDNSIPAEDMASGDVYLVYGNGIMLESYPGQYPGITKLVRQEQKNKEYQEKYADYLEQFCPEPDTSTAPDLSVSYMQPDAVVSAAINKGGYGWSSNGEAVNADSLPVLAWDDEMLAEQKISGETEFTMQFTYEPQSVEVRAWSVSERAVADSDSEYPEGESVAVEKGEDGFVFLARPDMVYQIVGTWQEGTVEYGFQTKSL